MIEAIFFDLYETLVTEFDPDWQPGPTVAERLGLDSAAFNAEWLARHDARMLGALPDYPSTLRAICAAMGKAEDEALIDQLHQERLAEKAVPFSQVDEGVLSALEAIKGLGLKLGLITNCAPEEVAAWDGSPLAAYFGGAVFSCDVGRVKPDPAIYGLACRKLDVASERAMYVGDGGSDELSGAHDAGLRPYWASWFIDRWPQWRREQPEYKSAQAFPRLRAPAELEAVVAREACRPEENS